jgi:hypothetical protein
MIYSTIARSVALAVIGVSIALPVFAQDAGNPPARQGGMFRNASTTNTFRVGAPMRNDDRASTSPRQMGNATSTAAPMQNDANRENRGISAIEKASHRILIAAGKLENLSPKLSARIDAAALDSSGSAGVDVNALHTALADLNAKVIDAKVQANAAISETTNLKPDNGDAAILASNTAILKDARTKIQAARADIQAAFKDAQTIANDVRGKGITATTTEAR